MSHGPPWATLTPQTLFPNFFMLLIPSGLFDIAEYISIHPDSGGSPDACFFTQNPLSLSYFKDLRSSST